MIVKALSIRPPLFLEDSRVMRARIFLKVPASLCGNDRADRVTNGSVRLFYSYERETTGVR